MIQKAIEYLVNLGQIKAININNEAYSTGQLYPIKLPKASELQLNTLSGLVDYLKTNCDAAEMRGRIIHVTSHDEVRLVSSILQDRGRETYIKTNALKPKFNFDQYYSVEGFIVAMQSCFLESEDRAAILKVVGNLKEETVRQTSDDGISQAVTAKAGIATVEQVKVPNPVYLAPFRTFSEVAQPASKFIFRMKGGDHGPQCALFEADGGAWKAEAMGNVREYLATELSGEITFYPIIC